jgi:hypothetical protein
MFSGKCAIGEDEDGCFFLDREGSALFEILNWLRGSQTLFKMSKETRRAVLEEGDLLFIGVLVAGHSSEVLQPSSSNTTIW